MAVIWRPSASGENGWVRALLRQQEHCENCMIQWLHGPGAGLLWARPDGESCPLPVDDAVNVMIAQASFRHKLVNDPTTDEASVTVDTEHGSLHGAGIFTQRIVSADQQQKYNERLEQYDTAAAGKENVGPGRPVLPRNELVFSCCAHERCTMEMVLGRDGQYSHELMQAAVNHVREMHGEDATHIEDEPQ